MKNIKLFTIFSVLSAVTLFTSCNPTSSDYISAVPKEPIAALKINAGALFDDSKILENNLVNNYLRQAINEMPRDMRSIMRDILAEPSNSGIDVDKPAVFVLDGVTPLRGLVCCAVGNKEQLNDNIEEFLDETDNLNIQAEDGYTVVSDRRNVWVAFDDEKLVVALSEGVADATEYMKMSENALSNSNFCKFVGSNDDAGLYLDYTQLSTIAASVSPQNRELIQMLEMYDGVIQFTSLNFDDGRVVMRSSLEGNTAVISEYMKAMNKTPSGKYLEYVPKDAYGVALLGLQNLTKSFELLDNKIRKEFEQLMTQMNFDMQLIDDIDGDVLFALLPRADLAGKQLPQMMFFAESKKGLFDYVATALLGNNKNMSQVATDLYSLGLNKRIDWSKSSYNYDTYSYDYVYTTSGYDYYLGYIDDCIFVMPENIYAKCVKDGEFVALRKNFSDSPLTVYLGKSAVVCGMDNIIEDCKDLEPAFTDILKYFESVRVLSTDVFDSEFVIEFADKDVNSLKQIVDIAMRNIPK